MPSGSVAQSASRWLSRLAISAAAARVKVRHRMRAGSVPSSISPSSRSVRTLVLPVPAEAATQTDAPRTRRPGAAPRVVGRPVPVIRSSSLVVEPFEVAVIGKARRPLRRRHRRDRASPGRRSARSARGPGRARGRSARQDRRSPIGRALAGRVAAAAAASIRALARDAADAAEAAVAQRSRLRAAIAARSPPSISLSAAPRRSCSRPAASSPVARRSMRSAVAVIVNGPPARDRASGCPCAR